MLFGRSKRQFRHRCFGFRCPVEAAACLLQNTVQKPEAPPDPWLLGRDNWWGTVGLSGTCLALPPPGYLQGRLTCRRSRQGLDARTTFLPASAGYACSLSYGECSE